MPRAVVPTPIAKVSPFPFVHYRLNPLLVLSIQRARAFKRCINIHFFLPRDSLKTTIAALFRVTRLGEFSPIGQLFTLGSLLKNTKVAQFWATFSMEKSYVFILTKIALGYTLGDFFTNSSSHTGPSRSAQFCI
jgi:hypothetical protein